ncbi:hypothetical protein KM043_009204 [Ampulex compressa]|nr:hypothetical protein KM043_009204 [Ampulex compressa]
MSRGEACIGSSLGKGRKDATQAAREEHSRTSWRVPVVEEVAERGKRGREQEEREQEEEKEEEEEEEEKDGDHEEDRQEGLTRRDQQRDSCLSCVSSRGKARGKVEPEARGGQGRGAGGEERDRAGQTSEAAGIHAFARNKGPGRER